MRSSDRSVGANNNVHSKNGLSSSEYDPMSSRQTYNDWAEGDMQNNLVVNQLLIGDADVSSMQSNDHGRPATVG